MGVGELMVCSWAWGLCLENQWMWLICQTEKDNNWATEQEERALVFVTIRECVYCKSPAGACVFFFWECSSGQWCFLLIPEIVHLSERDRRGDWVSLHVRLRIKQKAVISLHACLWLRASRFSLVETDYRVSVFCIFTFYCGVLFGLTTLRNPSN